MDCWLTNKKDVENDPEDKKQLLVDKTILKNYPRRLTNLSMAWIDYRNAYDMVSHSWTLKWLNIVGTARKIITSISIRAGEQH